MNVGRLPPSDRGHTASASSVAVTVPWNSLKKEGHASSTKVTAATPKIAKP
jgi:hypothetical protein